VEKINIQNLKIFCLVVEQKSISKAAQISYISQPGVTRQIKGLEDFYGLTLFTRKDNRLTVTEAGRSLYPIAKAIVNDFDSSMETMNRLKQEHQYTLHVGASLGVGEYIFPQLLGKFKTNHPEAQLSLKIGDTKDIVDGIRFSLSAII
jgi:DNA-binding transcriptional LysR family regulator